MAYSHKQHIVKRRNLSGSGCEPISVLLLYGHSAVLAVFMALALAFTLVLGFGGHFSVAFAEGVETDATGSVCINSLDTFALGESATYVVDASDNAALIFEIPRFSPVVVTATCNPSSIEVGIDCGMDWMCGINPCLCGSADHWGGCSCNGLTETMPTLTLQSSDESVIRVEQWGQTQTLRAVGPGTAEVTCTPALTYHQGEATTVTVLVRDGISLPDILLVVAALVALGVVAAAVGAVVLAIRKFVRIFRRDKTEG